MAQGGGIARLLKTLRTDDWLTPAIDRYYNRSRPERWVHADPTIHPSTLGSPCALDLEFSLLGHRTPADGQGARRMDNGTDVGKRWARALKDMGILISAEEPAHNDDPLIAGSIDVIVQHRETGKKSIGEIKSMHSFGFKGLPTPVSDRMANMRALSMRYKNYCLQLTTYMTIHGLDAWFLFENKDNQEYRVFWVTPTPEMIAEVFTDGPPKSAQQAFYEGVLLPPPYKRTSKTCQDCYRKKTCFRFQDGDVELWKKVQQQFKQAGVVMKEPVGWPAAAPLRLDEDPAL